MKLVVGLGNPGRAYERTRHNAGFLVVEELARRHGGVWRKKLWTPVRCAEIALGGERALLAEPTTFMNRSGAAAGPLARRNGLTAEAVLVVYDDVSLPLGRLRVRADGSAGGHNGVKSLIAALGGEGFPRVRVGVGPAPAGVELADFVLGRMTAAEWTAWQPAVTAAADAVESWVTRGTAPTMNWYNGNMTKTEAET